MTGDVAASKSLHDTGVIGIGIIEVQSPSDKTDECIPSLHNDCKEIFKLRSFLIFITVFII